MIEIQNNGPLILRTNYWQSSYARAGAVFLSCNAGAWRLLVPPKIAADLLQETRAATEVIFSRGPWPEKGRAEALEVMFEDSTDAPYTLHVGQEQWDVLLKPEEEGAPLRALIYTAGGLQRELPARYRRVPSIPCMQPWVTH